MSDDQAQKFARKGTKSCTECRRRKVRCIRSPDDAPTCQRCVARGSTCIAQTYSTQSHHGHQQQRLPSRYRISQLESKVASLTKVIQDIQSKLGHQPFQTPETATIPSEPSPGTDISDDESSVADVVAPDQPWHLRSLFENEWLSVDTRQQSQQDDHKTKVSAHLLDIARQELQKLIPSRDEVSEASSSASKWLVLLHTLLPQPFVFKSAHEILEAYDNMHNPDVDAMSLATWLLVVAITARQTPQDPGSPATNFRRRQWVWDFSRRVSDTVESKILSHDRLAGTMQGLAMAVNFLRLQMAQGNFQKAWLRLRHFLAIAELMGLSKADQNVQLNRAKGKEVDNMQLQKSQLWQSLCFADRLSSLMINLPPGTRRYRQLIPEALSINGIVQPRIYLNRLTDIATKIQYSDEVNITEGSFTQFYSSALEVDRELRMLMSQTPKSWWNLETDHFEPDHMVQFFHYCTLMRIHLPFTMRQDPGGEYVYSRMACMDACESVARHYHFLHRMLPTGIFLSPILDLQVFTATVVLLLTSHSSPSMDRLNLQVNKAKIDSIVAQVIQIMDEKTTNKTGTSIAQHGGINIRSLYALLQEDSKHSHVQELDLKVPLLGKIHIRRNSSTAPVPISNIPQAFPIPTQPGMLKLNEQLTSQQQSPLPINTTGTRMKAALQTQEDWQWDPLSWSIEDTHDDIFRDALMAENFDQFAMWPIN